jgi:hypothetical protein
MNRSVIMFTIAIHRRWWRGIVWVTIRRRISQHVTIGRRIAPYRIGNKQVGQSIRICGWQIMFGTIIHWSLSDLLSHIKVS